MSPELALLKPVGPIARASIETYGMKSSRQWRCTSNWLAQVKCARTSSVAQVFRMTVPSCKPIGRSTSTIQPQILFGGASRYRRICRPPKSKHKICRGSPSATRKRGEIVIRTFTRVRRRGTTTAKVGEYSERQHAAAIRLRYKQRFRDEA